MDAEDPKSSRLHSAYLPSEVALQFLPPPPLPLPHHPVLGIEPRTSHTLGKFLTPEPYPSLTTSHHTHSRYKFHSSSFFFFKSLDLIVEFRNSSHFCLEDCGPSAESGFSHGGQIMFQFIHQTFTECLLGVMPKNGAINEAGTFSSKRVQFLNQ